MHEENEFGIAAHWAYQQIKSSKKHSASWKGVTNRQELLWVEQLRNWQKSLSQKDFLESIKVDFFKDRIFALTPQNDVLDLPAGSTPVDFAYRIHSEIGDQCVGAKVNNRHVSLDYILHSGDIVEIVMQKGKKPSKAWLSFVKSPGAKKHITNATKPKFFVKPLEQHIMEFKIVNTDRPGYLKDVTNIFAEHKINITYLSSQTYSAFSNVLVRCTLLPKQKTDTILLKIRKVSGTKEVSVRVL
jgi:GTP pyrophosphokinase